MNGQFFLNGDILDLAYAPRKNGSLGHRSMEPDHDYQPPALSDRQVEILTLVAGGASNKDISKQLGISENTVKSHIKLLFSA